jgi:hypothetical protein
MPGTSVILHLLPLYNNLLPCNLHLSSCRLISTAVAVIFQHHIFGILPLIELITAVTPCVLWPRHLMEHVLGPVPGVDVMAKMPQGLLDVGGS